MKVVFKMPAYTQPSDISTQLTERVDEWRAKQRHHEQVVIGSKLQVQKKKI